MVRHLHSKFLQDPSEYARSVEHWIRLWEQVDPVRRARDGWRYPWMSSTSSAGAQLLDGNPIFSAYSPQRQRGIRVIQYAPTSTDLEADCWLDTFAGPLTNPEAVQELVIACALSEEAADYALDLMQAWVREEDGNSLHCAPREAVSHD